MIRDQLIENISLILQWVCRIIFVLVAFLVLLAAVKLYVVDDYDFTKDTVTGILFFLLFYVLPTYYLIRLMIKDLRKGQASDMFFALFPFYIAWSLFVLLGICAAGWGSSGGGVGAG